MINSTAFQSSSCAQRFSDSRLSKLSSSSAAIDSPESTCAFTSRAAVTPPRSTPFASPSRRRQSDGYPNPNQIKPQSFESFAPRRIPPIHSSTLVVFLIFHFSRPKVNLDFSFSFPFYNFFNLSSINPQRLSDIGFF
ncbi:40S ribosomal protein s16-1 [Phtheirospermum japonicum]|uniref:40S ribosomal protein s16-1 n=1 Tax=Phtheirospermum japonicum TaxID=374723 RepID=A0A830C366_9LAMI|nr:40S ribosomal protein s16-1 [Phtheirospermum japonicum]